MFGGGSVWAYTDQECINCHREESRGSLLHVSINQYKNSIHGEELGCKDCHVGVKNETHETTPGAGAVDCNACHDEKNRHGAGSGSGNLPQCYSCHTKHHILPPSTAESSVNPKNLSTTCGSCHPVQTRAIDSFSVFATFRVSSHKKEDFAGDFATSDCLGCHQGKAAHGEKEPIYEHDCYRCHLRGDGTVPLWGYIHPQAQIHHRPKMMATAILYLIAVITLLIAGFVYFTQLFCNGIKTRK